MKVLTGGKEDISIPSTKKVENHHIFMRYGITVKSRGILGATPRDDKAPGLPGVGY